MSVLDPSEGEGIPTPTGAWSGRGQYMETRLSICRMRTYPVPKVCITYLCFEDFRAHTPKMVPLEIQLRKVLPGVLWIQFDIPRETRSQYGK